MSNRYPSLIVTFIHVTKETNLQKWKPVCLDRYGQG